MKRRVEVRAHKQFAIDVQSHVDWLLEQDREDWVVRLAEDIADAWGLLGRFPSVGTAERAAGGQMLRRLILRRTPFVVWFVLEEEKAKRITFLRLFHARQHRPRGEGT